MKILKEERLIIGEKAYRKIRTISELAKKYETTYVNVFNYERPACSLNYLTPIQFKQSCL